MREILTVEKNNEVKVSNLLDNLEAAPMKRIRSRTLDELDALLGAPPVPIVLGGSAAVLLLQDRRDESRVLYERLAAVLDDPRPDARWGGALTYLVELAEAFEDAATAACVYDQLRDWSGEAVGLGTVEVVVGALLAEHREQVRHLVADRIDVTVVRDVGDGGDGAAPLGQRVARRAAGQHAFGR